MILALTFIFGLVIGSFVNVCIPRIPRDESIVLPTSHCNGCGTPIKLYDNIPVVSWQVPTPGKRRSGKLRVLLCSYLGHPEAIPKATPNF